MRTNLNRGRKVDFPSRLALAISLASMLAALAACSSPPDSPTGGAGGTAPTTSAAGSGGLAATSSTSGPTGGSAGSPTTSSAPCGAAYPPACDYPSALLGYYEGADQQGVLFPAPGEEAGATASCFEPLSAGTAIARAVVGFQSDPPAQLPLDAWALDAGSLDEADPGAHVVAPQVALLESVEPGPSGLTSGVYVLAAPLSGDGLVPCLAVNLADYIPPNMVPDLACYQPRRTWWKGLPVNPDGSLSWAMLACPETDEIATYEREFPYELRP